DPRRGSSDIDSEARMQIGLRLLRADGTCQDVRVTAPDSTTVGDVAGVIRRLDMLETDDHSDPADEHGDTRDANALQEATLATSPTLAVVEPDGSFRRLDASLPFSLDVLAPGDRIRVVESDRLDRGAIRAVLRVHAGPDAGLEVELRTGATTVGRGPTA